MMFFLGGRGGGCGGQDEAGWVEVLFGCVCVERWERGGGEDGAGWVFAGPEMLLRVWGW